MQNFLDPMQAWTASQSSPALGYGYGVSQSPNPGTMGYTSTTPNFSGVSPSLGGSATSDPSWLQRMVGWTDENGYRQNGWGGFALGGAQAALGAYMGFKQLGLAKDSLAESKRQFNLNFGAQRNLINSQLEDRQRARMAFADGSSRNNYRSVKDYMNTYQVN